MIYIGYQGFSAYKELQYSFDAMKISFVPYPDEAEPHIIPVEQPSRFPGWAIALIVIGVLAVVLGIGAWLYRRYKIKTSL